MKELRQFPNVGFADLSFPGQHIRRNTAGTEHGKKIYLLQAPALHQEGNYLVRGKRRKFDPIFVVFDQPGDKRFKGRVLRELNRAPGGPTIPVSP